MASWHSLPPSLSSFGDAKEEEVMNEVEEASTSIPCHLPPDSASPRNWGRVGGDEGSGRGSTSVRCQVVHS